VCILYLEARGMDLVDEGMDLGLRDFGVRVLEQEARDLEPSDRADLQNEAISGSEVLGSVGNEFGLGLERMIA
jgi:hypothetical protein